MPNPQAVILLMGTVAQNADIYKYPIYNFLESRLFYWTIYNFAVMRKEGIYTLFETLSQMEEVMEKIKTEYKGKVNVVFMNLMEPESKRFFEYYGVATIPTQVLLDKKGKEFFRHTGFYSADELSTHFTMKK